MSDNGIGIKGKQTRSGQGCWYLGIEFGIEDGDKFLNWGNDF